MDAKDIVIVGVALGGWLFAGFKEWLAYRERKVTRMEDRLFSSLSWFEGKTQKRSIGIAVIEGLWPDLEEYRKILIPLLANQAIYLLAVSNEDTDHERNNLQRIMRLILAYNLLNSEFSHLHCELLELTSRTTNRRGSLGNSVSKNDLESWNNMLSNSVIK